MFIGHTFDTYVLGVFASTKNVLMYFANFANISSKKHHKGNLASENYLAHVKTYN